MRRRQPGERRYARCAAHIAETDEQKCSRRCIAVTTRIATGDASTAGPASVPKKGQCAGAASNENGRECDHLGRDGGKGGHQHFVGSVRWGRVAGVSSKQEAGGEWNTFWPRGA